MTTEAGERFSGRALLLTPPAPQSLQLIAGGNVPLPERIRGDLEQIDYAPCLAVLAQLAGASLIPEPGGLWFAGEPISWMADNQRKGVSPGQGAAITIHTGPQYRFVHEALSCTFDAVVLPERQSSIMGTNCCIQGDMSFLPRAQIRLS